MENRDLSGNKENDVLKEYTAIKVKFAYTLRRRGRKVMEICRKKKKPTEFKYQNSVPEKASSYLL